MIAYCEDCGDEYSEGRMALGILVCLSCGEHRARHETNLRRRRVMPMHKSNYVYLGSDASLHRQKAKEMANKVVGF